MMSSRRCLRYTRTSCYSSKEIKGNLISRIGNASHRAECVYLNETRAKSFGNSVTRMHRFGVVLYPRESKRSLPSGPRNFESLFKVFSLRGNRNILRFWKKRLSGTRLRACQTSSIDSTQRRVSFV